jgi:Bacterial Ig domain
MLWRGLMTVIRYSFIFALLLLTACSSTTTGDGLEVSLTGLEATTYVSESLTFTIAVVGGTPDSLELRRNGQLFQLLSGNSFTWDATAALEGSYTFIARARVGDKTFDSPAKDVIVDHTPASLTFTATPSATPLVLPGSVALAATASDTHGIPKVEFFDGSTKIGEVSETPYALTLQLTAANRGIHAYTAKVTDRAGNVTQTPSGSVPAYVRETVTLSSEASLDGCIENGYDAATFQRKFTESSCTFTTSYPILHFFSFDRSTFPAATQVEQATLRFHLANVTAYKDSRLASVSYDNANNAPAIGQTFPNVSNEPEENVSLITGDSGLANDQSLEVSTLVQEDVTSGRTRSQFRFRTLTNGPSGLGGTLYLSEAGEALAPTLELQMLVP